jgi:hypothetical protein
MVASLAKAAVLGLAVLAFFLTFDDSHGLVPVRFALILLCIFLYFSAQHEDRRSAAEEAEREDLFSDPNLSADLVSLEGAVERRADPSGPLQRWLERRRELQLTHQRQQEADEERSLDEILERLHQYGRESLSPADRALLERISARYRSRLSH